MVVMDLLINQVSGLVVVEVALQLLVLQDETLLDLLITQDLLTVMDLVVLVQDTPLKMVMLLSTLVAAVAVVPRTVQLVAAALVAVVADHVLADLVVQRDNLVLVVEVYMCQIEIYV